MNKNVPNFFRPPHTKQGWWAVGLAAASIVLLPMWSFLPGGALWSFLCGLAGGIIALSALLRQHERSWLSFLALLPMVNVLVFILAEFLFPH